jgi:hypothetical protein
VSAVWPNKALQPTALRAAAELSRVCRAWHRASEVKGLAPGVRAAEGEEQGQGVTARWGPQEAPSKEAGRRTGPGEEGWHTRDERARDREVLHARWGVLDTSGVDASQAQCLTPGELYAVCGSALRVKQLALTGMQTSAESIRGTRGTCCRPERSAGGLTGCWTEAMPLASSSSGPSRRGGVTRRVEHRERTLRLAKNA